MKSLDNIIKESNKDQDMVLDATEQDTFKDLLYKSPTLPYTTLDAAWQAFTKGLADKDNDGKFTLQEVKDFFAAYEG